MAKPAWLEDFSRVGFEYAEDDCLRPLTNLQKGISPMADDPHGTRNIPIGTPVVDYYGELLGKVREAYPHYLLVARDGEHDDFEVPVHSITGFENGKLRVSVTRKSSTEVDDVETAHRMTEDPD